MPSDVDANECNVAKSDASDDGNKDDEMEILSKSQPSGHHSQESQSRSEGKALEANLQGASSGTDGKSGDRRSRSPVRSRSPTTRNDNNGRSSDKSSDDRSAKNRARHSSHHHTPSTHSAHHDSSSRLDAADQSAKNRANRHSHHVPTISHGAHHHHDSSKLDAADQSAKNKARRSHHHHTASTPGAHHSHDRTARHKAKRSQHVSTISNGAHHHHVSSNKPDAADRSAKSRARRSHHTPIAPGAHHSHDRASRHKAKRSQDEQATHGVHYGASSSGGTPDAHDHSRMESKLRAAGLDDNDYHDVDGGDDSKPQPSNDSQGYNVEAELVHGGSNNDRRQKYNETNPQQQHHGSRTHQEEEDNQAIREAPKKRPWGVYVIVFLLIVGGALAAVFLTGGGGGSTSDAAVPDTAPIDTNNNTPSPSTGGTNTTTSAPSTSPSMKLIYQKPSVEDCFAISRNQTIFGQEELEQTEFGVDFDVTLSTEGDMTEAQVQALLDALQETLVPALVGCTEGGNRRDLSEKEPSGVREFHRHRELFEPSWRYVIFNAYVTGNVIPDLVCAEASEIPGNCHRVLVKLTLFLKGRVRFLDIIQLISERGKGGSNLVSPLGLGEPFLGVKMIGANGLTPTEAPSKAPSGSPSSIPSGTPSGIPSATPSTDSSLSPTIEEPISQTIAPVLDPSNFPSNKPSFSPTRMPTLTPAPGPTPFPTIEPSAGPSSDPSRTPTQAPAPDPTPDPTCNPTAAPTAVPTAVPTSNPTSAPTLAPTPLPTQAISWAVVANKSRDPGAISSLEFRSLVETSPNRIIRRVCSSCLSSHQDIYYKRLTDLPAEDAYDGLVPANFLDIFLDNWFDSPSNLLNVDFELYSSYDDALSGQNRWTYCNYNAATVGFPRDCGPTGEVWDQFTTYSRDGLGLDFEFFVESVTDSVTYWVHAAWKVESSSNISDNDFRILLGNSPNGIVRRRCDECLLSHQNIFYKRITPLPAVSEFAGLVPASFLDLFLDNWYSSPSNLLNVDFELYSTYQDALAGTNRWTFCNYDDATVGFPRDCGPTGEVWGQFTTYSRDGLGLGFTFYVESVN